MAKNTRAYWAAILAAALVTVSGAVLHGRLSHRWSSPPNTAASYEFVTSLPREFGEWHLLEEQPLPPNALDILQCNTYANRIYANRRTGEQLAVTMLAGPAGPMTVHTADVCMTTRDFESIGEPDRVELKCHDATARFYRSAFRSTTPSLPSVEVFYAWTVDGRWDAPDAPRFAYGGVPILIKLQVASTLWPNVAAGPDGLAGRFITELLEAMPDGIEVAVAETHPGTTP